MKHFTWELGNQVGFEPGPQSKGLTTWLHFKCVEELVEPLQYYKHTLDQLQLLGCPCLEDQ